MWRERILDLRDHWTEDWHVIRAGIAFLDESTRRVLLDGPGAITLLEETRRVESSCQGKNCLTVSLTNGSSIRSTHRGQLA